MISFTRLDDSNIEELTVRFAKEVGTRVAKMEIEELLLQYNSMQKSQECEVAVALSLDCVFVRIYSDGEYSFAYPYGMKDGADSLLATVEIVAYCRREMIPVYLFDFPREDLDRLMEKFSHIDASAYLDDDDIFAIRIKNECDLLNNYPKIEKGNLSLTEIEDGDLDSYVSLAENGEVNKYWGYDAKDDKGDEDDTWYLKVIRTEFNTGVALTVALRESGRFVGEVAIYDFDYCGSGEFSLRILPQFQNCGIGKASVSLILELAKSIGLKTLRGTVDERNTASINLCESFMQRVNSERGRIHFIKNLVET